MLQATAKHAPHLGQIRHLCREAARFVILLKFEHVWLDLVILLHLLHLDSFRLREDSRHSHGEEKKAGD